MGRTIRIQGSNTRLGSCLHWADDCSIKNQKFVEHLYVQKYCKNPILLSLLGAHWITSIFYHIPQRLQQGLGSLENVLLCIKQSSHVLSSQNWSHNLIFHVANSVVSHEGWSGHNDISTNLGWCNIKIKIWIGD